VTNARVITLQRDAICGECHQELPAGVAARYYSNSKIYHEPPCNPKTALATPLAPRATQIVEMPYMKGFAEMLIQAGEIILQRLDDIEKYEEDGG
jgi:hypothetical protein